MDMVGKEGRKEKRKMTNFSSFNFFCITAMGGEQEGEESSKKSERRRAFLTGSAICDKTGE
jgi:hypothetical protein